MDISKDDSWSLDKEHELTLAIKSHRFATFDARYGRTGSIACIHGACDICHKQTNVLAVDCSEGEYAPGAVCLTCVKTAFRKHLDPHILSRVP